MVAEFDECGEEDYLEDGKREAGDLRCDGQMVEVEFGPETRLYVDRRCVNARPALTTSSSGITWKVVELISNHRGCKDFSF